jgi:hypothetical protein
MMKLSKNISGYLPPEDGPFECERCHYFRPSVSCELVEGTIEPEGCCNLFTQEDSSKQSSDDEDDSY